MGFAGSLKVHRTLPDRLVELVRLRIAFFNQCRSCMAIRYTDAVNDGLTEELVCSLERPEDAADLTEAEKAAIAYGELMEEVASSSPEALVIVMTGNPSVESSVSALRAGAWDYLPKPFSATHFQILMGRAAHAVSVARESRDARMEGSDPSLSDQVRLYGKSPALRRVIDLAT